MMVVDCQTHVFPREYAEVLLENNTHVRTRRESPDRYRVSYGDLQQLVMDLPDYDPQRKVRDMDEAGIAVGVLSVNIPGPELLEPSLGVRGARACNDYLAEVSARYPQRFVGLASLPLQDVPSALEELDRADRRLGLRGVFLPSHINGRPLDAPEFEPLYAMAEERRLPLVLHPTVPTWCGVLREYSMIPMVGFMVDTSIAMLRLILGGVMEHHPDLLVVHPHCGGVLPYLMPRIEEQTEVKRRGRENIRRPPGDYYRRVFLDVVSPSADAIDYVVRFSGPDRLLFGSDHPWVRVSAISQPLDRLQLPAAEKEKILSLNARRLFRIGA